MAHKIVGQPIVDNIGLTKDEILAITKASFGGKLTRKERQELAWVVMKVRRP